MKYRTVVSTVLIDQELNVTTCIKPSISRKKNNEFLFTTSIILFPIRIQVKYQIVVGDTIRQHHFCAQGLIDSLYLLAYGYGETNLKEK